MLNANDFSEYIYGIMFEVEIRIYLGVTGLMGVTGKQGVTL